MRPSAGRRPSERLAQENARLRARLEETEAVLSAISTHGVDAFLVQHGPEEEKVLVLDGVDRPYRLLIERMHQAAVTVTADGTILYANGRLSELLCVPHRTLPGARLADHVIPEDWALLSRLLERGSAGDAAEELRLRCGAEIRWVHVTISMLTEGSGLCCLIITDLTQQKRAEEERSRFVSERAAAEAAAAVLRETNRRKDEFLAMLAHELRSPLAPIRNGLEILDRISSQAPEVRTVRDMMYRQTQNLIRLVNDLLDVARVTQGKITLQLETADLRAILNQAVEACRPGMEQRQHRLELVLPERPVPGRFDPTRMTQVVINLLSNAVKFTPPGGAIAVSLEQLTAGQALVRVRDDGIGMDPALLPRIFELFAQADASVSRSEGGLGVGLTLARRLVEMHGGSLTGASAGPGQGSEFVIRLPLASGIEPLPAASNRSGHYPGGSTRHRILVVDDNRDAAESLALLLEVLGHQVQQVHRAEKVVATAVEFRPDLVLLDIGLPGMDGYEVAASLRDHPGLRHIRLVAISGYGSEEYRERSRAAGFDDHITKPVETSRLERLLDALGS
jgi:PAS domain S-box-containing protein